MSDKFENYATKLDSPASGIFPITPSDDTDLAIYTRSVTALVSGNVSLIAVDGSAGTIYVVAGVPFPIRSRRIRATDTTATGIHGLL